MVEYPEKIRPVVKGGDIVCNGGRGFERADRCPFWDYDVGDCGETETERCTAGPGDRKTRAGAPCFQFQDYLWLAAVERASFAEGQEKILRKRIERAQVPIGILRAGRGNYRAEDVLDEVVEALKGAFDGER